MGGEERTPEPESGMDQQVSKEAEEATAAAGVGTLSVLPVFFPLQGKRVVLAGASERAVWKAELLHATGAKVEIFDEAPCAEMRKLVAANPRLQLFDRPCRRDDLTDAALALVDAQDDDEARRFRKAAKAAGVPMNAIDNPAHCDFQFGAIVNRSPLVIGISTHGAAPVFGQTIRGRLEALLPQSLQGWARAATDWRERLMRLHLPFHGRRRFWERFAQAALTTEGREPVAADFSTFLEDAVATEVTGRVTLVGAGPGDPDLLTLKGLRALQGADIVLYDNLVAPPVVALARREAERIDVGKRGHRPSCKQDEITEMMVRFAKEGKRVVRLKGGDPMIFGRAAEEIDGCRAAGVAIDVVPGVTAALGAAASLGASLTERSVARRLQFITAHARDGKLPEDLDWRALCDPHAATVVYMGVKTMDALVEKLLAHGMTAHMPAVLVERATHSDERRITGTIGDMPEKVRAARPDGPCLLLIGLVFADAAGLDMPATMAESLTEPEPADSGLVSADASIPAAPTAGEKDAKPRKPSAGRPDTGKSSAGKPVARKPRTRRAPTSAET